MRARELGIRVGDLSPGPQDAITDVEGVRVGHSTIVRGEGPLVVGEGPVRTGVTVVCPRKRLARDEPVFAGSHTFNGNGEMTGLEWIREAGILATPVAITNTHSVGVVRDALVRAEMEARTGEEDYWCLPVAAETYDGTLNDINGMHVTTEHVFEALDSATSGPVEEGSVGGGTGMICHEFKGGIGTASRRLPENARRLDGRCPGAGELWTPPDVARRRAPGGARPEHGTRPLALRERPGDSTGGDRFHNRDPRHRRPAPAYPVRPAREACGHRARQDRGRPRRRERRHLPRLHHGQPRHPARGAPEPPATVPLQMVTNDYMTPLFHAAAEATEEAILNALLAAGDMTGRDGITAHGLTPELLLGALEEARKASR